MSTAAHRLEFPPSLTGRHVEELARRAISQDFALASAVRTVADNEVRALNFQASLPTEERSRGLQGILFPYRDLKTAEEVSWRLKPDTPFSLNGKGAKYLSRAGDKVHAYFPHTTTAEHAANVQVNLIITEGEFKTLALAEKIAPIASRKTCVVGLQGVNGGWHRDQVTKTLPDGTKETVKEGAAHLIDDLEDAWEWKKRLVYLTFDSDVGTKAHATTFKQSKRAGAWGAEYTLAQLLRAKGAEVRIVILPPKIDAGKYGADDYIAEHGPHEFLKLLYNNWTPERDPDEVLYQSEAAKIRLLSTEDLAKAPPKPTREEIIEGILRPGSTVIMAGPPGCGKSIVAKYACFGTACGESWMNWRRCKKGRALYVQTELTQDELEERTQELHLHHPDFKIINLHPSYPLNFWEQDGFSKRRETGNRDRWLALLEQIRSFGPSLICFDVLADFTSSPLTDPEAASHIMEIMIRTAQISGAGVFIVHHIRKTGGRVGRYEGQDDLWGSYRLAARAGAVLTITDYTRDDGTHRFKLLVSKMRHKGLYEAVEINKFAPWEFTSWRDDKQVQVTDHVGKLIDYLAEHPAGATYAQGMKDLKWGKDRWYRTAEAAGAKVRKIDNLYFLTPRREAENDE
jgi:hypothetical protein